MLKAPITAFLLLAALPVLADPACDTQASEKKLAGAAKSSFLKKCHADSLVASCDAQSADKSLAGAAKRSFTQKCVREAAEQAMDSASAASGK